MSERVQKDKQSAKTEEVEADSSVPNVQNEDLTESTDDLLGDIDDILEENAEEFVKAYVQKGGQ